MPVSGQQETKSSFYPLTQHGNSVSSRLSIKRPRSLDNTPLEASELLNPNLSCDEADVVRNSSYSADWSRKLARSFCPSPPPRKAQQSKSPNSERQDNLAQQWIEERSKSVIRRYKRKKTAQVSLAWQSSSNVPDALSIGDGSRERSDPAITATTSSRLTAFSGRARSNALRSFYNMSMSRN